ncbi:hypothetical protein KKG41_00955 [Patescibacteria group bacterium]|nr:hypothetical protein [Patescibacteria group bacterium]
MFLTTHAAAGVLISQRFESPLVVFLLSIIVHFIMDFIPHGDENLYQPWESKRRRAVWFSSIDFALVVIMIMVLYNTVDLPRFALISAGLAGSLLPDLISHVFPLLHKKFREVFLFRSLGFLRKKVFLLHPIVKSNNFLHRNFHNFFDSFFDYRISAVAGFSIQILIIAVFLVSEFI